MPYYEDIVHLCDIPRYHAKHNPKEIAFIFEDNQTYSLCLLYRIAFFLEFV